MDEVTVSDVNQKFKQMIEVIKRMAITIEQLAFMIKDDS